MRDSDLRRLNWLRALLGHLLLLWALHRCCLNGRMLLRPLDWLLWAHLTWLRTLRGLLGPLLLWALCRCLLRGGLTLSPSTSLRLGGALRLLWALLGRCCALLRWCLALALSPGWMLRRCSLRWSLLSPLVR